MGLGDLNIRFNATNCEREIQKLWQETKDIRNMTYTTGTSGTSGTSGSTGSSGASGTSGTSGINGNNGTSGIDGTSGVNGTSGLNGTSGTSGLTPPTYTDEEAQDSVGNILTDGNGFNFDYDDATPQITLTTSLTQNSVPFIGVGGALTEDNTRLYYSGNHLYVDSIKIGRGNAGEAQSIVIGNNAGINLIAGSLNNNFIGYNAGNAITTGGYNVALGWKTMESQTTGSNAVNVVAIGQQAVNVVNPSGVIGIGAAAAGIYGGTSNSVYIGVLSGYQAITDKTHASDGNVGIGGSSLYKVSCTGGGLNGRNNTAVGYLSAFGLTTGQSNVHIGVNSGGAGTGTGSYNIAIGQNSIYSLSSASSNIAIGTSALQSLQNGANQNIAIGNGAGSSITTGLYNLILGGNNGSSIATLSNNIIISDGQGNIRLNFDNTGVAYLQTVNNDNTEDKVLTWNSTSKAIEYRDVSTITSSSLRFGVSGEDTSASAQRSFDLNDNNLLITDGAEIYIEHSSVGSYGYFDLNTNYFEHFIQTGNKDVTISANSNSPLLTLKSNNNGTINRIDIGGASNNIEITPSSGNLFISNLTNYASQDRLLGIYGTDNKVGYITIGSGLSLSSGTLTATGAAETDPVFLASAAAGITGTDITNWNTAYGWGNHASAGYALDSAVVHIAGTETITGTKTFDLGVVINETGANSDTRIEGDTDQNLVFVDASADKVLIGTSTDNGAYKLQVNGYIYTNQQIAFEVGGSGPIYFGNFQQPTGNKAGFSTPGNVISGVDATTLRFGFGGGGIYYLSNSPTGLVEIRGKADEIQLDIRGNSTQTSNLTEWKNSTGTTLSKVKPTGAIEVPDDAYDATSWNGNFEVPTKNAIRDKIESMSAGSGITRTIVVTSGSITMGSSAATDYVYKVVGNHIMTLPTAIGNTNRYTIKNAYSADITVDTTSLQTIDGTTSILIAPEDSVEIISDGSNWIII